MFSRSTLGSREATTTREGHIAGADHVSSKNYRVRNPTRVRDVAGAWRN